MGRLLKLFRWLFVNVMILNLVNLLVEIEYLKVVKLIEELYFYKKLILMVYEVI